MSRPNFLVIMTDDQGPWARGSVMPELITPTIDALAATGLEFDRFCCASPVCSPARASILTGRMPSAHGVHDWIRSENDTGLVSGHRYLDGMTTTPERLAAGGYRCGHSGKWHLGDARRPAPGFELWFAHRDGGGPYFGAPVIMDGVERTEPRYMTDVITEQADRMLVELSQGDEPFYLQVHYTAPHTPWEPEHHPPELLELYSGCDFPSVPRPEPHPWFRDSPLAPAAERRAQSLQGYCAALTGVDRGVATLLATLDRTGSREQTYVIFTSDNGFSCGQHGYWGKGNGTTPLNLWDPSIMVPFLINRPGTVEPGIEHALTSAVSIEPTLLDLAGLPPTTDPWAAGSSFAGRIRPADGTRPLIADDRSTAVVVYDEYGGTRMIRTAEHKFIRRESGPDELYDLITDPGETTNLDTDPRSRTLRRELSDRLDAWFAERVRPSHDAYHRPVSGSGQNAPVWAPLTDADRYA